MSRKGDEGRIDVKWNKRMPVNDYPGFCNNVLQLFFGIPVDPAEDQGMMTMNDSLRADVM